MQIRDIAATDTLSLRQMVLWPKHPISASQVPGDAAALHFGGFKSEHLICVASLFPDEAAIRLRKFATHPDHQGQGLGSQMLRHLLAEAKARNHTRFWCDARETALPFYLRFGFTSDGARFFKRDVAYLRLEKPL